MEIIHSETLKAQRVAIAKPQVVGKKLGGGSRTSVSVAVEGDMTLVKGPTFVGAARRGPVFQAQGNVEVEGPEAEVQLPAIDKMRR